MGHLITKITITLIIFNFQMANAQHTFQNYFQQNFEYAGAFRIPNTKLGDSRVSYSAGPISINNETNSFYIVGHAGHQAIAEFEIPTIKSSQNIKDLEFAKLKQPFHKILFRMAKYNSDNLDRITGMKKIDGQLFVNAVEYYDADESSTDTTFIVDQPQELATSTLRGFFKLRGKAHAAGWITRIPKNLQGKLRGSYLVGSASNLPINSRFSIGPSAFSSYLDSFAGIDLSDGMIPTTPLLDFSLKEPISPDLYNKSKSNSLWTEVAEALYGFILPESNIYLVVGNNGGLKTGVGYKINQENGSRCPGPCALNSKDYYNFIWAWDLKNIKPSGEQFATNHALKPNSYGPIKLHRFAKQTDTYHPIIGADYDAISEKLYILVKDMDNLQNPYEKSPLVLIYNLQRKYD